MSVNISSLNYVPTLALRAAEIKGLEKLPKETKNKIQPVFLFAPWPNAKTIERAVNRIETAFPNRPFFLDIDRYYQPSDRLNPDVKHFWESLQSRENGYRNWTRFIESIDNASPCVQFLAENTTHQDLQQQIRAFQKLGRTFAIRFELDARLLPTPAIISLIMNTLREIGTADYAIILDGGWTDNSLNLRLQIKNFITEQLGDLNPAIPIIVSYTTIPRVYSTIKGIENIPFDNREAIEEIIRETNKANIIYGDWGSTKPRSYGIARAPAPRIDVAFNRNWLIARNADSWDYKEDATHIIQRKEWQNIENISLWGIEQVKETVNNSQSGIHSPQSNIAARVNMHLYMQAFYNADGDYQPLDFEEPWED